MVKLSEEVAEALKAAKGEPISVDVPGLEGRFVVVDQSTHNAAMAALQLQRNVELLREGIADVEAGRVQPLDEAMAELGRELGFRPRQTT
jgi:PHD/YefM family antitoxin component YafN of YafNO toxin-antitoxin module